MILLLNILFALSMPFTHIGGYVAAGIGLIIGLMKWKKLRVHPVFLALSAFMVYGLIRNAFSLQPAEGYQVMLGYFMHWLAPFVLGWSLTSVTQIKKAAGTYYVTFAVLVFFSFLAYFGLFYQDFGPGLVLTAEGLLKGFRSHIAMGALCLIASFMSLSQALRHDRSVRIRAAFGAGTAFFLVSILLTGSRGYYIGAMVSYMLFGMIWLIRTRRWKVMFIAVCAGVVMVAGLYLTVPSIQKRVHRTDSKDNNIIERFAMYRVALAEIKDRPLFGFGPGQAVLQTNYYAILPQKLRDVQRHHHMHSMYLHLSADFGLAGFGIFLAAICFILRESFRLSSSKDYFVQSLGVAVFFSVIGILAGDCFDTLLRGPGVAMELFWLAGLAAAAAKGRENSQA